MSYTEMSIYAAIPIILIFAVIRKLRMDINIRIHTMMAIGFVLQKDVGTLYVYLGPILIGFHNVKRIKKNITKKRK